MIRNAVLFLLLFGYISSVSQTIPGDRVVDWSRAGLKYPMVQPEEVINFVTEGGTGDGITPNDDIFSSLLNSLEDDTAIIFFPNGSYLFNQTMDLKENIIIRGESSDSAILVFNLNGEGHLINISGNSFNDTLQIVGDIKKDSLVIEVNDASAIQEGDYIVVMEDDSMLVTSSWALNSTGQINKVINKDNNFLTLDSPFRRNFYTDRNVRAVKLNLTKNIGVESLKLIRLDATELQNSNIHINYASNCRILCIESENCNYAHISVRNSSNIEITGSWLHKAFDYGNGGKAYGIMLHHSTGECLVRENIYDSLRHSMIVQAGANGNVFAYNYSVNPYWTDVSLPSNSAGDIVLHGNYPYANLFEGNTVQNIVIDDSHGINGKYNTFFRNRAELYGIVMNFNPASDNQNFIGNEITNTEFLLGNYLLFGTDHFEYGNNKKGTIIPDGTNELNETSLYLDSIPEYYISGSSWPPIGVPNILNSYIIEAEELYENGLLTKCVSTISTIYRETETVNPELLLFPNPTKDHIHITLREANGIHIKEISLFNHEGSEALKTTNTASLNLKTLSAGFYFLKVKLSNGRSITKKLIKTRQ